MVIIRPLIYVRSDMNQTSAPFTWKLISAKGLMSFSFAPIWLERGAGRAAGKGSVKRLNADQQLITKPYLCLFPYFHLTSVELWLSMSNMCPISMLISISCDEFPSKSFDFLFVFFFFFSIRLVWVPVIYMSIYINKCIAFIAGNTILFSSD